MSETPILSPELEFVLQLLRRNKTEKRIIPFILKWYDIAHKLDYEFGFIDYFGLEAQTELAVNFYNDIEQKWQQRIQSGEDEKFLDFFCQEAKKENIYLPDYFKKLMEDKENEFTGL